MYKNILVPVDGTEPSTLALAEAIKLAKSGGATLHVLHVVDEFVLPPIDSSYMSSAYYADLAASMRDAGREILEAAVAVVRRRAEVEPMTTLAETMGRRVADLIVETANAWPADLIVMGTHGRRGLRRLVLGSDAEAVLRKSPVPVLMVRGSEPSDLG